MELSDFDKCEICINCKLTHSKQDNKLYIIKKMILDFEPLSYTFITFQKDVTNVYVRPTTEPRSRLKFQCDINYMYFVIIIPLIYIKHHVPLFSIVQSTVNGIIEPRHRE